MNCIFKYDILTQMVCLCFIWSLSFFLISCCLKFLESMESYSIQFIYLSSKIEGYIMYVAFPHLLVYLLLLFHCYLNAIWNICESTGSLGFRFDVSTKNKKVCDLLAITLLNLVSQLSFRQTNKQTNKQINKQTNLKNQKKS